MNPTKQQIRKMEQTENRMRKSEAYKLGLYEGKKLGREELQREIKNSLCILKEINN